MNMNSSNFAVDADADQTKTQINGQEIVFYNGNNNDDYDDDFEADPVPANASNGPDVASRGDAPRGFTLTTKMMVCGFVLLCSVGAAGIAVGMGIAGSTESATKPNLQAQKMESIGNGKSGKQGGEEPDLEDYVIQCIFIPLDILSNTPPPDPAVVTPKVFKKEVWKPYLKFCGEFWFGFAYYFTLYPGDIPFIAEPITETTDQLATDQLAGNGCTALMNDISSGTITEASLGGIKDCADEISQVMIASGNQWPN